MSDRDKFADKGIERAVLSSIIKYPDLIIDAEAKLEVNDFLSSYHRDLYSVLKSLYRSGASSFDLMTVVDLADKNGVLKDLGGPEYIKALMLGEFDPNNFKLYLSKLLRCSTRYKLFEEAARIQKDVLEDEEEDGPSSEIIARAEARLMRVSMETTKSEDAVNIASGLRDAVNAFVESPVPVRGLPTGIDLLDKAINGLSPGSLTVVAARAKVGKSTLLMNIAAHHAFDLGMPVLYVDTEMPTRDVQTRLLAHLASVPERAIINGTFITNPDFCSRVEAAVCKIEQGQFFHRYYPGYSMEGLRSLVKKYHTRERIGSFFFDYIKVPEVDGSSVKEHQLLGNVTAALKDVAGQLDIPVISAAQLKRSESGGDKSYHHDSDVADSDKILRYCNTLMALGRKTKKEVEEEGLDCGTHRVQILAARGGGATYKGIDLYSHLPTLTVTQALNQSNGLTGMSTDSVS